MAPACRQTFEIRGTIQGVGFRPALFRLATELGLGGSVQNRSQSVELVLEGEAADIERFLERLPAALPPHAQIEALKPVGRATVETPAIRFEIIESDGSGHKEIQIPADLAMCSDCRAEILDPTAHRYHYPFTTCTNCGPRYTVVNSMPYDRERTTLNRFPLCPICAQEYRDPSDRRFHAETIACPTCGPTLQLCDLSGEPREGDPLIAARQALAEGRILALRGIGGFLLAADAMNREALLTLRQRKARPDKPFAVMAPSLEVVKHFCLLSDVERTMLTSSQSPIVILHVRAEHTGAGGELPLDLLSPDTATLGVMLPTSPLHVLLAGEGLLVMTSGNRCGEPIAIENSEALARLSDIADLFLLHDREINLRCDDSLCIQQQGHPQVWRRARGYAPRALRLPRTIPQPVLAMGAELKNAIGLGYTDHLILSPHIGDLETPEALDGLEQAVKLFPAFLQQTPALIAVDLHPDMHATRLGRRLATAGGLPVREVQHHHAHGLACLGEHGLCEGLALVFDGTGMGTDGSIWGAELLEIRPDGFSRRATFAPVSLPGGDQAVKHPARQLLARWIEAGVPITPDLADRLGASDETLMAWIAQTTHGINAPLSHAAGRLFDGFAAAMGIAPLTVSYEGQAAIRLEAAAKRYGGPLSEAYPFNASEAEGMLQIDWAPMFVRCARPRGPAHETPGKAMAFHRSLALAACRMVEYGFSLSEQRTVALSGGVFMNQILTALVTEALESMGATVLLHREIPPNDGGIAAGQVMACAAY
ncbi:MAG: carbamoyltransferase HypF [Lentisphaerae bacterium]|nr:carbamoyltransferase HypF [Lentisphaerota bacterium]